MKLTAELAAKRLKDFAEGPSGKSSPAIVQSGDLYRFFKTGCLNDSR
jgi:hypothetical protein